MSLLTEFHPGQVWLDTDGNPIQAHGGGVLFHEGVYYWYGENKDADNETVIQEIEGKRQTVLRRRVPVRGVSCYSSTDLYNWTHAGIVLPAVLDDPDHDLHPSRVMERPKVLYNQLTGTFVMWFHADSADYQDACAGVAVADAPIGPFRYLGSFRPHDAMSRDMTLFQDDDGKAYHIHSSEENRTLHVTLLTDDFLQPAGPYARIFENQSREAPAWFKHDGRYHMISSGCTGWAPNRAEHAVADTPFGPWQSLGDPCAGPGAERTFEGQSTHVLPVHGQPGQFILMLDQWNPTALRDSRYVWLPIEFDGDRLRIPWRDRWSLGM
ncbi:MAG: family 43 glycosylhydrolase [Victivallales bacterium]|nr:family 43 glycosylhydrolase [Victivallales bacterium]